MIFPFPIYGNLGTEEINRIRKEAEGLDHTKPSCFICEEDINTTKSYMYIADLPGYAHIGCVHDRLVELDKIDPEKGIIVV